MLRILPAIIFCVLPLIPFDAMHAQGVSPNIVLVVADDLGWNDVGYHGSEIKTPRIDELAAGGVRLERYYVQPSCSPTRASLMTGMSAVRLGLFGALTATNSSGLPLDQYLMPELLKDVGYSSALVGKWHLGHRKREYLPNVRGFDHFYGNLTGGIGYWDHVHGGAYDWQRNDSVIREGGYTTHLLAAEAIDLIEKHDSEQPLFLYASFNAPHIPNEAPGEAIEKYLHLDEPRRRIHAAMVSELDTAIGSIVDALRSKGVLDNTLFWFMSDNGGVNTSSYSEAQQAIAGALAQLYPDVPVPLDSLEFLRQIVLEGASDNSPLRKGKRTVYEGGVRVPSFIYWNGHLEPNVIDAMVTAEDVLPSILGMLKSDQGRSFDGVDKWSMIAGKSAGATVEFMVKSAGDEALYHYPWKLIRLSTGTVELYNVQQDPRESNNLAEEMPEKVTDMVAALDARPRGKSINLPRYKSLLNPSFFGGDEVALPWLEQIE